MDSVKGADVFQPYSVDGKTDFLKKEKEKENKKYLTKENKKIKMK